MPGQTILTIGSLLAAPFVISGFCLIGTEDPGRYVLGVKIREFA
jgi:hypothetical protein